MFIDFPGVAKWEISLLSAGLTKSNDFFVWCQQIARGKIVRRPVTVILYNVDGTEAMKWNFNNAFPVKWSGPQFKSDDTSSAIESIELAHDGFTVA